MSVTFTLDTSPFNFRINTTGNFLKTQLQSLYPDEVLGTKENQIIDFEIDFRRHLFSFSQSYAFRLGRHHFRETAQKQMLPVFEWGLNWAVSSYQNRYLCIHAAVLEKNGVSLIMPAPPGSGKSTLCALLMLSGWRLLSDEHCLIDPDTGLLQPFVRPVALKNRSIPMINQRFGSELIKQRIPDTVKGTIGYLAPTADSWRQRQVSCQPCYIIFPKYNAACTQTEFSGIAQSLLFMQLAVNCFNYTVLGQRGFLTLQHLVAHTEGIRLEYANTDEALALIGELC